ncbi:MAG TPA: hypothetical protein VIV12_20370, partial [Streptosporangiaceae bacterium]
LLRTSELPDGSSCKPVENAHRQDIWHAWNDRSRFCDFHHLGGLKAPVARVVANRRRIESATRPRREVPA